MGSDRAPAPSIDTWEQRRPPERPSPLLYVDCFSGIAGDMLLGALLDAGLAFDELSRHLAALPLTGYRLDVRTKQSYGITGTKLDVQVDEAAQPERSLRDILALLDAADLPFAAHAMAAAVFRRLGAAEAAIHNVPLDHVHFHEVGAIDSIVDIVGAAIGLHLLGITQIYASSLPLPGGTVRARHGLLPAPAPATLEVLARVGAPTRPAPVQGELVTPTGAAILAELATFEQPMMRIHRVGYGYGTKELPWPNAVRVWLGEPWSPGPPRLPSARSSDQGPPTSSPPVDPSGLPLSREPEHQPEDTGGLPRSPRAGEGDGGWGPPRPAGDAGPPRPAGGEGALLAAATPLPADIQTDEVVVIEANLDDSTPEQLGYAMERLLAAGALDVYFTSIQMKKNRPGTLLGAIVRPEHVARLSRLILAETTTLGVRLRHASRIVAARSQDTVETPYGPIRVKVKLHDGRRTGAPEYDDCAEAARRLGVPFSDVYQAAVLGFAGTAS